MVIKPILRDVKTETKKRIAISIHDGGKNPKIKLVPKRKIKKSDWNSNGNEDRKNWVRSSCPNFRDMNDEIYDMLIQIRAEKTGKAPAELINTKRGKDKPFLSWTKDYIKLVRNKATKSNSEQALMKLEKYLEEIDNLSLSIFDINKSFCKGYYNWLLGKHVNSSANQYFGVFRTIYNEVTGDDANKLQLDYNPFEKLKYEKNKIIHELLTNTEFLLFRNYEPRNRGHLLAKNLWLFQFSQAMRVKEPILIQWKDLNFFVDKNKLIWGEFTAKTTTHFHRELDTPVIELLLPCIQRYDKDIIEVIKAINHDLNDYKRVVEELKVEGPSQLTTEDILIKLQTGYDPKQMQYDLEEINDHQGLIEEYSTYIEDNTNFKKEMLGQTINRIKQEYPNDYVWDKPQLEGMDRNKINNKKTQDYEAYKRCVAGYNGYLGRIAKNLGITRSFASHKARHTASNFMIDGGMDMQKVSRFLTHSNFVTTELYINRLGLNIDELSTYLADRL